MGPGLNSGSLPEIYMKPSDLYLPAFLLLALLFSGWF
jgi:hypothetical protein